MIDRIKQEVTAIIQVNILLLSNRDISAKKVAHKIVSIPELKNCLDLLEMAEKTGGRVTVVKDDIELPYSSSRVAPNYFEEILEKK